LLVLGLVLAVVALLRARPVALATPQISVSVSPYQPSATVVPGEASASSTPATQIVVHVLGAVRRPGLVQLPDRSRVSDAIDAAGGLRGSAEPGDLNLAQIVVDGQQILIGSRGDPGGEVRNGGEGARTADSRSAGPAGGNSPGPSSQLDLNAATAAQLDTLPGVGPVTADRILNWRAEHGRFRRVEELQEVEGIGPKTYAQLAPLVRV
jgi:competence protein ComEA